MDIKKLILSLVFASIFIFISMSLSVYASETPETSNESINEYDEGNVGFVEEVMTEIALDIGDFFYYYLSLIINNELLGGEKGTAEDITIDRLIFNKIDAVNANFFKDIETPTSSHTSVRKIVNKWYGYFRTIAILVYIIAIVGAGIKIVLQNTPLSKADMKTLIMQWSMGIVLLFFFPYVIKYAFELNEGIVRMIEEQINVSAKTGLSIGKEEEFSRTEVEFRSPEYISKYTGQFRFGDRKISTWYAENVEEFKMNLDVMRLMRAYAGATKRFVYVILWYIMMGQMIILLVKYYKRYFIIAILITIFPIVMIMYIIRMVEGRKGTEILGSWCRELFINIFVQSIHAIIYAITTGVVINQMALMGSGQAPSMMNWIIMIVSINFIYKGEGIVRKILGMDKASTATTIEETSKAGRKGFSSAKSGMGKIFKRG